MASVGKVGRNDPCPCGSGKKYKQCCERKTNALSPTAWLAIVGLEETTEQPKALASGTTMTGTALFFGVVPLVAVHLVGFAILMSYGASRRHNRQSGLWLGA